MIKKIQYAFQPLKKLTVKDMWHKSLLNAPLTLNTLSPAVLLLLEAVVEILLCECPAVNPARVHQLETHTLTETFQRVPTHLTHKTWHFLKIRMP